MIQTNTITSFPFVETIGLYPTMETLVPQAVLILLIALATIWVKKSNSLRATE
ncbi:hypothetical protein [Bacillus sp. ISL-34]|uniref:hypothetical protein n=1 Tax=Bacillus sp. ISL-34 TaxID=2819121 RepID=UPI002570E831|nr:hypothetical protein [Bacillus sp. ISL-34]